MYRLCPTLLRDEYDADCGPSGESPNFGSGVGRALGDLGENQDTHCAGAITKCFARRFNLNGQTFLVIFGQMVHLRFRPAASPDYAATTIEQQVGASCGESAKTQLSVRTGDRLSSPPYLDGDIVVIRRLGRPETGVRQEGRRPSHGGCRQLDGSGERPGVVTEWAAHDANDRCVARQVATVVYVDSRRGLIGFAKVELQQAVIHFRSHRRCGSS